jgi:lipopolysaccharide/colanic/teichoic acid biosynthesis glycosyltransferase
MLRAAGDLALNIATVPFGLLPRVKSKRALRVRLYLQLMMLDVLAVILPFVLLGLVIPAEQNMLSGWEMAGLVGMTFLGFAVSAEVYSKAALEDSRANRGRAFASLAYALLLTVLFFFATKAQVEISRPSFSIGSLAAFMVIWAGRRWFERKLQRIRSEALQNELLIVDGVPFDGLEPPYLVRLRELGLKPDLGDPVMLHNIGVLVAGFDRVVVLCPADRHDAWTLLLRGANVEGELMLPDECTGSVLGLGNFSGKMTHVVSRGPLSISSRARKRMLDLAITVPAILLLAPLLIAVAIAIKFDSRGPVLFLQDRVGRGNKLFKIMKFRSMRVDKSDVRGARSTSRDDDRITRVGAFIRKTSIDELPQLFNVLKGDMSLVGPRPHALGSLAGDALFWEVDHRYWLRHSLKPGITGLAQVRGFRGATEERADLERRLSADLEYVQNWSLGREISILLRTFLVLVHRNAF